MGLNVESPSTPPGPFLENTSLSSSSSTEATPGSSRTSLSPSPPDTLPWEGDPTSAGDIGGDIGVSTPWFPLKDGFSFVVDSTISRGAGSEGISVGLDTSPEASLSVIAAWSFSDNLGFPSRKALD